MRNTQLILLGGNKLHRGFDEWKSRNGIEHITVIDWNENPDYKGDEHIRLDIKDINGVLKIIEQKGKDRINMCYTSADIAVLTQVAVHKYLGLAYPDNNAIEKTINKSLCTQAWSKSGLLNRYSCKYEKIDDIDIPSDIENIIIKPNISSGSRGITIIRNRKWTKERLEKAFIRAKNYSRDSAVILEEFVIGIEYTVEMLGDNEGNVAVYGISKKYYTKYVSDNRIATKLHYNPKDVSDVLLDSIAAVAIECYRSVGLKCSLGHLELIVADNGKISPLEMGARSSGYIATHCIDAINQDSLLMSYSNILRGEKCRNGIVFERNKSAMYFFYDIRPGKSIRNVNIMDYSIEGISSLQYDRSKIKADVQYEPIDEDAERFGYEILVGDRDKLAIENIEDMEQRFINDFMEKEG